MSKEIYLANLKKYHQELESFIETEYSLKPSYSEAMSWGFNTTVFYIQCESGDYVLKLTKPTPEKFEKMKKEIFLSNVLNPAFQTSKYIISKNGDFITYFNDLTARVSKYISGTPPFDMSFDILCQIVEVLKRLHRYPTANLQLQKLDADKGAFFLHGDPTPSNFLVSFGKLCGVLDFEEAVLGPIEYDLSRLAIFSWFRMPKNNLDEVVAYVLNCYKNKVDKKLIKLYFLQHAKSHLQNTIDHKDAYSDMSEWEKECKYAKSQLELVESTKFF